MMLRLSLVKDLTVYGAIPLALMLTQPACTAASADTPARAESRSTAEASFQISIDPELRNNPYFKMGARQGKLAAQERLKTLSCDESSVTDGTEFEFEDQGSEPFIVGYLSGFYPEYEAGRLDALSACASVQPESHESKLKFENAFARMQKVRDLLEAALKSYEDLGCEKTTTSSRCPKDLLQTQPAHYYTLAIVFLDQTYFDRLNRQIDSYNQSAKQVQMSSNSTIRKRILALSEKEVLTDADIDLLQELTRKLLKSGQVPTIPSIP